MSPHALHAGARGGAVTESPGHGGRIAASLVGREGEVGHFHPTAPIWRSLEPTGPHDDPGHRIDREISAPRGCDSAALHKALRLLCDSLDEVGMRSEYKRLGSRIPLRRFAQLSKRRLIEQPKFDSSHSFCFHAVGLTD